MVKFTISDPMFQTSLRMVVDEDMDATIAYIAKFFGDPCIEHKLMDKLAISSGVTICTGNVGLIALPSYELTPDYINILSHEVTHFTTGMMDHLMCPHTEATEEIYAYFTGYYMGKVTKKLGSINELQNT